MADEKISDLALITNSELIDFYTLVRSAANMRCTRLQFMTGVAGEQVCWQNTGGSFVGIQTTGRVEVISEPGEDVFVCGITASGSTWDSAGNISHACKIGQSVSMSMNLAKCHIDGTGHVIIVDTSGASAAITWVTTGAGNWAAPPTDMAVAINRLAAALVLRTGGAPIP